MHTKSVYDEVKAALNRAADDVIEAANLPDTGTRDAINLVVNAALVYLNDPAGDLDLVSVVNECYESNSDEDITLDEVLEWINS